MSAPIRFSANADISIDGLLELIDSYPGEVLLNKSDSAISLKHDFLSVEERTASVSRLLDAITPN